MTEWVQYGNSMQSKP